MTQIFSMVVAVAAAIMMQPEISAAIASMSGAAEAATTAAFMAAQQGLTGAAITAAASAAGGSLAVGGLANTMIAVGLSSFASSALGQVVATGQIDFGASLKNGLIGAVTAGLTNGITFDSSTGSFGFNANAAFEGSAPSLSALAGVQTTGNALVPQAGAVSGSLPTAALALSANAAIQAGTQTLIGGGSFLDSLRDSFIRDAAAAGAYAIGQGTDPLTIENVAANGLLGCAASAATGTGCAAGAIGGATSAVAAPLAIVAFDPAGAPLTTTQLAEVTTLSMLSGGLAAGLAGVNAQAAATWAGNEATNNAENHVEKIVQACGQNAFCRALLLTSPLMASAIAGSGAATRATASNDSHDNQPQLPDTSGGGNDDDLSGGSQARRAGNSTVAGVTLLQTCMPMAAGPCIPIVMPAPAAFTLPKFGPILTIGSGGNDGNESGSTASDKEGTSSTPEAGNYSLLDPKAETHVLYGDGPTSGGHLFGIGKPGKSEFPATWSAQDIANAISDIATNPNTIWSKPAPKNGYITGTGTIKGVDVKVVIDPAKGRIVTGYPTNLPRNPK
ncbi:EndoU domain-containing protein [Burkholderia sp. AU19243]|nr:EndoU domain-containing protein [Burkholderia sp. AU19243]MBR8142587.1 EndoU domain-containing protein [Burkholderia vietnamiensis]MBR8365207.1 EndoU domain-containing protein [Burkholderia sp. AU19243]